MNARIMLLHLVHFAWCRTPTFLHVGLVTLLIPLDALLLGATLEKLRDTRSMFLPPGTGLGVSSWFHIELKWCLACTMFLLLVSRSLPPETVAVT